MTGTSGFNGKVRMEPWSCLRRGFAGVGQRGAMSSPGSRGVFRSAESVLTWARELSVESADDANAFGVTKGAPDCTWIGPTSRDGRQRRAARGRAVATAAYWNLP